MATEETPGTPATDSTETVDQEATGSSEETQDQAKTQTQQDSEQRLPDSHPLVKAYEAQKAEIRALRQSGNADKLNATTAELTTTKETLDGVQKRYDRLEEFLSKVGGPLGKALDSKSFTTKLFETNDDIGELVKLWLQDNPSKTTVALSSDSTYSGDKKPSMNDLFRSAAN